MANKLCYKGGRQQISTRIVDHSRELYASSNTTMKEQYLLRSRRLVFFRLPTRDNPLFPVSLLFSLVALFCLVVLSDQLKNYYQTT